MKPQLLNVHTGKSGGLPVPMRLTKTFFQARLTFTVLIASLLTIVLFSGCAETQDSARPAINEANLSTPTSSPTNDDTSNEIGSDDCSPSLRAGIQPRVTSQIDALNRGDFDEALGHASPSFQASVDTQAFQAIIESSFSYLLADNAVSFGLCLVTNGTPSLEVRVGQPTVAKLIYFFAEDKKQWWIDGAAPAADKLAERIEVS